MRFFEAGTRSHYIDDVFEYHEMVTARNVSVLLILYGFYEFLWLHDIIIDEKFISVIPASLVLIVSLLPINFVNWNTLYILISDRTRRRPKAWTRDVLVRITRMLNANGKFE